MMGFLTGVAANIVLGQLGDLTGTAGEGDYAVTRAWSVLTSPGRWDLATVLVGLGAMVLVVGLARTPFAGYVVVGGVGGADAGPPCSVTSAGWPGWATWATSRRPSRP